MDGTILCPSIFIHDPFFLRWYRNFRLAKKRLSIAGWIERWTNKRVVFTGRPARWLIHDRANGIYHVHYANIIRGFMKKRSTAFRRFVKPRKRIFFVTGKDIAYYVTRDQTVLQFFLQFSCKNPGFVLEARSIIHRCIRKLK